ncbi:MAG: electron transport complex subunit RsxE [Deltaproteobacteria bacterium]|nr:electron transport complex subunit RsxE [Deltaproteobacteria bacterium]
MSQDNGPSPWTVLAAGLWRENPIFALVIGLCPTMAVTNTVTNALVMGVATLVVLVGSSTLVSALRKVTPGPVRITIYIIIIATFVSAVDWALAALLPAAHKQLGAFISLIVVNCIILGRAEAFAARNAVWPAVLDALGMSLGFTLAMLMISAPREILGSGTLLGHPLFGPRFEPWVIMVLPPGGFLTMATELAILAWWRQRLAARRAPAEAT